MFNPDCLKKATMLLCCEATDLNSTHEASSAVLKKFWMFPLLRVRSQERAFTQVDIKYIRPTNHQWLDSSIDSARKMLYMIAFRDFRSSIPGSPLSDGIDKALVSVNEWLEKTGIRPLNVETITEVKGIMSVDKVDRGLRVWYEVVSTC